MLIKRIYQAFGTGLVFNLTDPATGHQVVDTDLTRLPDNAGFAGSLKAINGPPR